MELGPKIMGKKNKSIRVDPSQLAAFRKEMKGNPEWSEYASATDSEIVRIGIIFGRLHVQPDVYMMTLESVNTLVAEAIRVNIAEVARALGGVAQMNPDKTISVTRPGADSIETFKAKPPPIRRETVIH